MNLVKCIQSCEDCICASGTNAEVIKEAEEQLSVRFSREYTSYLKEFGVAIVDSHELTGLNCSKRVNVVEVTLAERELNQNVPSNLYVIEQTNVDGVTIWQDEKGNVYLKEQDNDFEKIANSIVNFLENY